MDNSTFDLRREIEAYTEHITHEIQNTKKRDLIKKEYISHMEDSVYHYMLNGFGEEEAFKNACNELGDVEKIQRMLTIAHKRDKISVLTRPFLYCFALVVIFSPIILSGIETNRTIEQWIRFISVITAVVFCFCLLISIYKYIRAFVKRQLLIKRVKRICKEKGMQIVYHISFYTSIFGKSTKPEVTVIHEGRQYNIKMLACLKKKDIYTLTSVNSFYTTNNVNPIFVSYHRPSSGLVLTKKNEYKLHMPFFYKSRDAYVKDETIFFEVDIEQKESTKNILCIHPISAKIQVVRTNRPEEVFDGDEFKGYTVYSGYGLCEYLKNL